MVGKKLEFSWDGALSEAAALGATATGTEPPPPVRMEGGSGSGGGMAADVVVGRSAAGTVAAGCESGAPAVNGVGRGACTLAAPVPNVAYGCARGRGGRPSDPAGAGAAVGCCQDGQGWAIC